MSSYIYQKPERICKGCPGVRQADRKGKGALYGCRQNGAHRLHASHVYESKGDGMPEETRKTLPYHDSLDWAAEASRKQRWKEWENNVQNRKDSSSREHRRAVPVAGKRYITAVCRLPAEKPRRQKAPMRVAVKRKAFGAREPTHTGKPMLIAGQIAVGKGYACRQKAEGLLGCNRVATAAQGAGCLRRGGKRPETLALCRVENGRVFCRLPVSIFRMAGMLWATQTERMRIQCLAP